MGYMMADKVTPLFPDMPEPVMPELDDFQRGLHAAGVMFIQCCLSHRRSKLDVIGELLIGEFIDRKQAQQMADFFEV